MHSRMPSSHLYAVSPEECAKYVLDRHKDQIDMHRRGKGCTGFLLGQVLNMMGGTDVKAAYLAVRNELDRRLSRETIPDLGG